MESSLVQFTFLLLVLVFGAGAEEALPKILGVGFPVLLAAVQCVASRAPALAATLFAISAGAVEDALSGLPPMTSSSYFLAVSVLMRRLSLPVTAPVLVTYPFYQLWLAIWAGGIGGGVYGRVLVAAPAGFITAVAVASVLGYASGKAAVGEQS